MGAFAPIASAAPSGPQNQSNQNQSNQEPRQSPADTHPQSGSPRSDRAPRSTAPTQHGVARAGARDRIHPTAGGRCAATQRTPTSHNHNKRLDYDNDGIACER